MSVEVEELGVDDVDRFDLEFSEERLRRGRNGQWSLSFRVALYVEIEGRRTLRADRLVAVGAIVQEGRR